MEIGIIGAGHIGQALARLAVGHGHGVVLSNSRGPETLAGIAGQIGCAAATKEEAARRGEVVVVTIPFGQVFRLDPAPLAGKVVIDTNNYYPDRDGRVAALDLYQTTTSAIVAEHLAASRVVKAFNAILATDLETPVAMPSGKRRALPIAGGDAAAKEVVAELHDDFEFEAVDAGSLAESWRFERAKPAYCIPLDREGLLKALARAERDVELPHGSWRR